MSARLPALRMLSGDVLLAAADRILSHPTSNVQRVAMEETYSLAVAVRDLSGLAQLAADHMALPDDPFAAHTLRMALAERGFLPPVTKED